MKKTIMKLCLGMGSLAFTITSINVNTTCMFFMHQPKLPKGAEKLKKI